MIITKHNYVTITKQTTTMQAPEPQKRKPGRPAKLGQAMPDKLRAANYRNRRREGASMAHENLSTASTSVLLAGLAHQIKAMGDAKHADTARDIAARIIKELCDRYEIKLPRNPATSPARKKSGVGQ
ncbi:hypothetical protein [Rhodoferax fermentans]|uniref:Uncharacterized protein n=1 Tax=Rhodoferax fermentans TaxID=28066 RepID=A0A1T1AWW0_RHOFE|nr:hypothetical protein [Rhodoferax fermentans]MBK1685383.1 hypothetical protein [Rhodoferax fermentans]OOV08612.1 hypothetical protein RF819_19630 [Rhodoferax fermentans]